MTAVSPALPTIDIGPLARGGPGAERVAGELDRACRTHGFFLVTGHGVPADALGRLESAAHAFFARPEAEKAAVAMARGGSAWRGWFPVGGELTSGVADHKEGLYLGTDLPADDPRVEARLPLHGPNLWPERPADLRPAVDAWMAAMAGVAEAVLRGLAVGLGLDPGWFARHLTDDPTILFRLFHYPAVPAASEGWGVAEHTDYGLLTLLAQDRHGGLEVRTPDGWIEVPPDPTVLVANIGDMLDRMTGGRYRSTPHRVRPSRAASRLSFPFFYDPSWEAEVRPLPLADGEAPDDAATRWDGTSLRNLEGTYGDYLTAKVARVFPGLADEVAPE